MRGVWIKTWDQSQQKKAPRKSKEYLFQKTQYCPAEGLATNASVTPAGL